ncbi:MAG: heme NO-binding domain-containing protein [Meiothermus sp.]|nr:heme NO-binding domain-containing protein [Meiothermus sp.]
MKGVIFTEFLEMVESQFGYQTVDRILGEARLASGGSYTAVGTYDHGELVQLVANLHGASGIAVPELIRAYGRYIFKHFTSHHAAFFSRVGNTFDFLESIDGHIHVEVHKLYPDAELPRFESSRPGPDRFVLTYRSTRPFADLAHGLIESSVEHFGESIEILRENLDEAGTHTRFVLTKAA